MAESLFIRADEVIRLLGVSKSEAYRIIKRLNDEMASKGYIVVNGRVNRRYLEEQIYMYYREEVRWAIATDLTENELKEKYGAIIAQYVPYVLLSMEHAITMVKYHSNNRKHSKRNAEHSDAFGYDDGELEKYHPELIDDPFGQSANMDFLYEALDRLPGSQRSRIQKYYMQDMSYVEITADEGVSPQAVQQSIARSLIFLKKILAGR